VWERQLLDGRRHRPTSHEKQFVQVLTLFKLGAKVVPTYLMSAADHKDQDLPTYISGDVAVVTVGNGRHVTARGRLAEVSCEPGTRNDTISQDPCRDLPSNSSFYTAN